MKWPQKELYTYNVQNGDKFIIDEKVRMILIRLLVSMIIHRYTMQVSLGKLRTRNSSSTSSIGSPPSSLTKASPRIAFSLSPRPHAFAGSNAKTSPRAASRVARDLFGSKGGGSSQKK